MSSLSEQTSYMQVWASLLPEPVRLVIWDLDDTFWRGTVTEGGITEYVRAHHDLVVELARRGIMSSICSKNNEATVMEVLRREGIAEYFIFPSISWAPKGPRLAEIIEAVQLRPATVMFIDDNHLNRAEAADLVPEMQVEDERFIPRILSDPRFEGKDDSKLTRLAQYKLLETRKIDEAQAVGGNEAFLRGCDIRVHIDYDIELRIDRAIELVNRTNQLNFTKDRLPEDAEAARAALRTLLGQPNTQAGLLQVVDRYGDYGFVGFYVIDVVANRLIHYCWSCRTLGMLVESWLYDRLGRPNLRVVGEVLTDLAATAGKVDWIRPAQERNQATEAAEPARRVFLRGGCDLMALAHYLTVRSDVCGEFNIARGGMSLRNDHSTFVRQAIDGITGDQVASAGLLGYEAADFASAMLHESFDVYVFSFWTDSCHALYRHPSGVRVPISLSGMDNALNRLDVNWSQQGYLDQATAEHTIAALKAGGFVYEEIDLEDTADNVVTILSRVPPNARVFILEACEENPSWLPPQTHHHHVRLNRVVHDAIQDFPNVALLHVRDAIQTREDFIDATHFGRMVYFRLFQQIDGVMHQTDTVGAALPLVAK